MKRRFVFTVGAHIAYWKCADLDQYLGGPFADHSGGLIMFAASDHDEATRIARHDPFMRESLLREWWMKEWLARGEGGA